MNWSKCPECGSHDPIGHEVRGVYDGVLFWQCGSCGFAWSRDWTGFGTRAATARSYVDAINAGRSVTS